MAWLAFQLDSWGNPDSLQMLVDNQTQRRIKIEMWDEQKSLRFGSARLPANKRDWIHLDTYLWQEKTLPDRLLVLVIDSNGRCKARKFQPLANAYNPKAPVVVTPQDVTSTGPANGSSGAETPTSR